MSQASDVLYCLHGAEGGKVALKGRPGISVTCKEPHRVLVLCLPSMYRTSSAGVN